MPHPILRTECVTKRFGGLRALQCVSIAVQPGGVHCIIGPNGAGKSTFFNLVSGLIRPDEGRVFFEGRNITNLSPEAISRLGMIRSFQTPRVFTTLSIGRNFELSPFARSRTRGELGEHLARFGILEPLEAPVATLGHGQRKRLELALAAAFRPKLLLLDEPTAGMNAEETEEIEAVIRETADATTVLVIEHDINFVRRMARFITVLHRGSVIFEGTLQEVERDATVREVYLGERA